MSFSFGVEFLKSFRRLAYLTGGMLNISMETEFPGSSASLSVSWVTVSAWSVSLAASPLIVHLCRSHSVRLTAVIGEALTSVNHNI